jgi:hypothetical protein
MLLGILLAISANGGAQQISSLDKYSTNRSSESCEKLLADRLTRVMKMSTKAPKKRSANFSQKSISSPLSDFLKDADSDNLFVYELKGPRKSALIIITKVRGISATEANLQDWLIQIDDNSIRFRSFAQNPNLVFWDEHGNLNYFTVTFSQGAVRNPSSNIVWLDFKRFQIRDRGTGKLIEEEKDEQCILNLQKPR